MSRLFNLDNPFFTFINKFVDLLFVSVLTDVFCLPALYFGMVAFQSMKTFDILAAVIFILTTSLVGPALTALYYAVVKSVRRERGYAIKEYWKSYKSNFKLGSKISMVFGLLGTVLYMDLYITNNLNPEKVDDTMQFIMSAVFKAILVILVMIFVYIFPVLSRFTMKFKTLVLTSFMMSIRHLPTTLVMALIEIGVYIGPVFVAYILGADSIAFYINFCFIPYMILPGVGSLLCSMLLEKVFKLYMKPAEASEEETGEDRWYLE